MIDLLIFVTTKIKKDGFCGDMVVLGNHFVVCFVLLDSREGLKPRINRISSL